ncbi:MAG: M20 family metallopeptidase [Actinomycetota bacterium]
MRALQPPAEARRDAFLADLRDLVDIDSGSHSPAGVNAVVDRLEARFRAGGWTSERTANPGTPYGDLLVSTLDGGAGTRILVIGHTDTVFDDGTVAERPFTITGDRATGPGVNDMKGGVLLAMHAIETLVETGTPFGRITFVCNPDEEVGSPSSHDVIARLAEDTDVALVFEAAREDGSCVSARKGVSDFEVDVIGRAAHAGVEPERGRSAIVEAAHRAIALHGLNGRWPGVTVNVGTVSGGTRPNVVPAEARMVIDLRSPTAEVQREAEDAIEEVLRTTVDPDVRIEFVRRTWHRPMEKNEGVARLADLARDVAADLGFAHRDAATGGGSDACTTAAMGVPTLDGLGPVGGDPHSVKEWMDVPSVPSRIALAAGLIARAGEAVTRAS